MYNLQLILFIYLTKLIFEEESEKCITNGYIMFIIKKNIPESRPRDILYELEKMVDYNFNIFFESLQFPIVTRII